MFSNLFEHKFLFSLVNVYLHDILHTIYRLCSNDQNLENCLFWTYHLFHFLHQNSLVLWSFPLFQRSFPVRESKCHVLKKPKKPCVEAHVARSRDFLLTVLWVLQLGRGPYSFSEASTDCGPCWHLDHNLVSDRKSEPPIKAFLKSLTQKWWDNKCLPFKSLNLKDFLMQQQITNTDFNSFNKTPD